jgi:glutathione synthase/RimK-type ligase-like ATP-grasp enzyme
VSNPPASTSQSWSHDVFADSANYVLTIAILTVRNDLHAWAVRDALKGYSDVSCHLIETNGLCGVPGLSWSSEIDIRGTVPTASGEVIEVHTIDAIWWRRARFPQLVPSSVTDEAHVAVINNDCNAALLGVLFNQFEGRWVNDPNSTTYAENKLVQLQIARDTGFRIPRTLVSQNPREIRQFADALHRRVVIKAVRGTIEVPILTTWLTEEHLSTDQGLQLCPAVYQEYVQGNRHIRAHCFGDAVYSVLIESNRLDWRGNYDVPMSPYQLSDAVEARLHNVLDRLGLVMGIVDLKLTNRGEIVWLEVNPQGQYLFAEALSGVQLTKEFVHFLYEEAARGKSQRI